VCPCVVSFALHLVPIVLSWMPESSTFCTIQNISRIMRFLQIVNSWHSLCLWLHRSYTGSHTLSTLDSSCWLWLAQCWHGSCLCKTRANFRLAHLLLPMQDSCQLVTPPVLAQMLHHAKPMPTLGASRVGTNVATCKSCANVGRGAVLTCVYNCSSYPRTKKVKIRNNYSCFNNCKSLISLVVATTATTMEK